MKKKILSVLLAMTMLTVPAFTSTAANLPCSINAEAATEKLPKTTSVKATVKDGKITLSWKKVKGAEAYGVYKYNASTKKYTKLKTTTKTKLTISAKNAGTYKFRIYSLDKVNGKYKKGSYAYKKVTVKNSSSKVTLPKISAINKGMKYGISLKEVQKAHNFKEYTEIYNQGGSLYILVENEGGSYASYAFYCDQLMKWGYALKDSESNFKKMCKHFEDDGWKAMPGSSDDSKIYTKDVYLVLVYRDDTMNYVFANITDMGDWSSAE